MTKTFELRIQDECLNPDPKARPKLETLLNDRLFRNDFITISRFLQNITLKSQKEKKDFFEDVMERLYKIPEETVGKCLSRSLLCRFVLLDTDAKRHLIPNILVPYHDAKRPTPKTGEAVPLFGVSTYRTYMIPEIYRVFHCHDYHIRMTLLTYFPHYIDLFEKENLEETILPQVLLGLRDINEDLAALSLRSLAELVPLLGRQVVIGGKAKTYFKKGMPKSIQKHHQQSNGDPVFSTADDVPGTKEGVFSSVNDVMGKPLLKDLAKLSKSYTVAARESEAESKRKAREQRQQEAMLKREKRRQERQMKTEKIALSECDEIVSYRGEDAIEIHTSKTTEEDTDGDIAHSVDSLVEEVSQDGEDWTGWDETNEEEFDGDDQELDGVDSDPVSSDWGRKPVIDEVVTDHKSSVVDSVDWNSHWTAESDKPQEDSSGSDTTCAPKNNLKNNMSKIGKSSSALSLKSGKKPKPKTNTSALGSEYIMEIEVKKIQAEKEVIDFFADMTPDITKTTSAAVKESETASPVVKETPTSTPTMSLKYTVTETEDITGNGGWGDDVDWDDNQF